MPERHEKLSRALDLILYLAASHSGRTVTEIRSELGSSRRTAERLLAAIRQVYGDQLEEAPAAESMKRWRLRPGRLPIAAPLPAGALAELEAAANRLKREGLTDRAALLHGLGTTLKAMMSTAALRCAEPDIDALLEMEGLAARPGPQVSIKPGLINDLRHALLACRRIRLTYPREGRPRVYLLEPCGLLYGQRPYLLATTPGKADPAVWRLDKVVATEVTDESFERRLGTDIDSLAAQCFGIWREPPFDVVLRFTAAAAPDAAAWRFHRSQVSEQLTDGRLLVRFRAGGLEEMAAHLASWGEAVEVLEPVSLRTRLHTLRRTLMRHHAKRPVLPEDISTACLDTHRPDGAPSAAKTRKIHVRRGREPLPAPPGET